MIKKSITYTNPLTDDEVTEEHYFHLSKADLAEMELSHKGGFANYLQQIVKDEDGKTIVATFKELIAKTYGVRTFVDGKEKFNRSEELTKDFMDSEAYSELFMELITDASAGAEFVNGVMPKGLRDKVELANLHEASVATLEAPKEKLAAEYTRAELLAMTEEEFNKVAGTDPQKMDPAVLQVAYQRKATPKS